MNNCLKTLKTLLITFFSFTLFVIVPAYTAQAQMFSVEEENQITERAPIPTNVAYIGLEPAEFTYHGPTDGSVNNPGVYNFDGPLLRLRYETAGMSLYIGVAGQLTGIDDIGYFDVGGKIWQPFPILRSEHFGIRLPVQIKASMNSASNNQAPSSTPQFRQATLEFGGGAEMRVRLGKKFRFRASAVPNYGFSFASGSVFGGDIFDIETQTRFYLDRIFGDIGLTAGWDYNFKRFDIEEDQFDYKFRSFSFLVGITF